MEIDKTWTIDIAWSTIFQKSCYFLGISMGLIIMDLKMDCEHVCYMWHLIIAGKYFTIEVKYF